MNIDANGNLTVGGDVVGRDKIVVNLEDIRNESDYSKSSPAGRLPNIKSLAFDYLNRYQPLKSKQIVDGLDLTKWHSVNVGLFQSAPHPKSTSELTIHKCTLAHAIFVIYSAQIEETYSLEAVATYDSRDKIYLSLGQLGQMPDQGPIQFGDSVEEEQPILETLRTIKCEVCQNGTRHESCNACNGTGRSKEQKCMLCNGAGYQGIRCVSCAGSGLWNCIDVIGRSVSMNTSILLAHEIGTGMSIEVGHTSEDDPPPDLRESAVSYPDAILWDSGISGDPIERVACDFSDLGDEIEAELAYSLRHSNSRTRPKVHGSTAHGVPQSSPSHSFKLWERRPFYHRRNVLVDSVIALGFRLTVGVASVYTLEYSRNVEFMTGFFKKTKKSACLRGSITYSHNPHGFFKQSERVDNIRIV